MIKELLFDIEFTEDGKVTAVSPSGVAFLKSSQSLITSTQIYSAAIEKGLHVRFENAIVRDRIILGLLSERG